jgi:nucleoside-diphosphate-sugar epimerase
MYKKILILGHRAYIAAGIIEKLEKAGFEVTCFSRGLCKKTGNIITGNLENLDTNPYFAENYDIVLNFILLKNQHIEDNIKYIKNVVELCKAKQVERLIHISSISVYSNEAKYINEESDIENNMEGKGLYSSQKIAIDKYLSGLKKLPFEICFVRPGFVVSADIQSPLSGIAVKLPFNFCVLLGNRKTSLPLIERDVLQTALVEIAKKNEILQTYLLLKNDKGTKFSYIRQNFQFHIITVPKSLLLFAAKFLNIIKILNTKKYKQIKGLFKDTWYDSLNSEKDLKIAL